MSHIFTSLFVLLLPFQWQNGRQTTALPTAVVLQLTTRSGFWLPSLPAEVIFSLFLLPAWLRLSIKRGTKAASLTDPLNNLPALSSVRLPTLLQTTYTKIKPPPSVFQSELLKISSYFLFIFLFSAESSCLQLSIPKLNVCFSLLWAKQIFLSSCLYTWNVRETSQLFCSLYFQVWMNLP